MESKTWWKSITYAPRIDYVSFQSNELVYVLAIEKLLGDRGPAPGDVGADGLTELNRIHSHLIWLGTSALELGAISLLWYTFDDRDEILDLFEMAGGTRMHTRYFQVGGLAEDLPPGFTPGDAEVPPADAAVARRLRVAARPKRDLARAHEGNRAALRGRRARARAVRADAALLGGELGPPKDDAVSRLRRGRVRRPRLPERRRLRPLQGAPGRDARVGAHRQPVPRPDRRDGRGAVDRRRPQGRPPAAARAAHVDGVPDPPLQDRHRGLRRARGRGLRRDRVPARRVRAATSSPTAGLGPGG